MFYKFKKLFFLLLTSLLISIAIALIIYTQITASLCRDLDKFTPAQLQDMRLSHASCSGPWYKNL